jgi:hypothetical protein
VAQLQANLEALSGRIDNLETENGNQQTEIDALETQVPECLSEDGNADAVFEGCNVLVQSSSGATDGAVNGEGNLIVGYDENPYGALRTGSHNLVIGPQHGYSSFGGLVAGIRNTISGEWPSISGGFDNEASAENSTVGGGTGQTNNSAGTFIP